MKVAYLTVFLCTTALAQSSPPDPCKILTPSDITTSLGTGFKQVNVRGLCSFVRRADSAMISVRESTTEPATKVVSTQRNAAPGAKSLSGACDAGFSRPSGSVVAAKGKWLVFVETSFGNKGDPEVAAKLATVLCSHL